MTKKQFLWLALALLLLAGTGLIGVSAGLRAQERMVETADFLRSYLSEYVSGLQDTSPALPLNPFLAQVNVEGTIASGSSYAASFDLGSTLDYIDLLAESEYNEGILLYINSPGGEMKASDELYCRLMDYKERTGRPIYCYFDATACSGGYYAAMPADEIYANRNCLCVNIGVYISTYNFSQLFDKLGIEQLAFKSSENKGIGMTGVPWTEEQKEIYQSIVDLYYQQFLEVVAKGRGLTPEEVRARDDGREMLAGQALDAGFIDGICRYEEYRDEVLSRCPKGTVLYEYSASPSPLSQFFTSLRDAVPQSDAQVLRNFAEANSGMVVMAYAG